MRYPVSALPYSKADQVLPACFGPVDFSLPPESVKKYLDEDQFALYELVWKRMVASQMADVIFDQVVVDIVSVPAMIYAPKIATEQIAGSCGTLLALLPVINLK